METTKTFVFPENQGMGGSNVESMLLGSMMNGGGGFGGGGMWNNPIWAIVFLAALRNGGIFGNDNNGGGRCQMSQIQEQLQTIQGNNSLMQAITGGTNEVRSLANTINCDVNAVQTMRAVMVIGKASSKSEYANSVSHEICHLAVMLADAMDIDLRSESMAYLMGDIAQMLWHDSHTLTCPACAHQHGN